MSLAKWNSYGLISLWGLTLAGTLSIARWPGDWGQAMCGVWGCGPPLQAVVACHVSWLIVLLPPTLYLLLLAVQRESMAKLVYRGAVVTLTVAAIFTVCLAVHEYVNWYVTVPEFQKAFFWNRVGLVLVTTVEVPLVEAAVLALVLLVGLRRHSSAVSDPELMAIGEPVAAGVDETRP